MNLATKLTLLKLIFIVSLFLPPFLSPFLYFSGLLGRRSSGAFCESKMGSSLRLDSSSSLLSSERGRDHVEETTKETGTKTNDQANCTATTAKANGEGNDQDGKAGGNAEKTLRCKQGYAY